MYTAEFKVEVFIPEGYVDAMREQLNARGVLKVGDYDHVLSAAKVTGYWRPLEGANPHSGSVGEISCASECKLEFRCSGGLLRQAVERFMKFIPMKNRWLISCPWWTTGRLSNKCQQHSGGDGREHIA